MTFSGKPNESLQSFLNKIRNGAKTGKWDDDYTHGQLYAQLQGAALQYVNSLPAGETDTYARLVQQLKSRFKGPLEQEKARELLRAIRRGRGETLESLALRIKDLARKGYPDASRRTYEELWAPRNTVSDKYAAVSYTHLTLPTKRIV